MKQRLMLLILLICVTSIAAQTPVWEWAWQTGIEMNDKSHGTDIVADGMGNSYITGYFEGATSFSDTVLVCDNYQDAFVAKLDPAGNLIWVSQAGGDSEISSYSIALDNQGNVYIAGSFHFYANFGSITLDGNGMWKAFAAKLDANGNWVWAKCDSGTGNTFHGKVVVDNNSAVWMSGVFTNSVTFGNATLTNSDGLDVFTAKLDTNGNWLGAVKASGTSNFDYVFDLTV